MRIASFVTCIAALAATTAQADVIDFEAAAKYGGDNANITSSYLSQYGVSMSMYVDHHSSKGGKGGRYAWTPRFEQVGIADGGDAFNYTDPSTGKLTYGSGLKSGLGNYYLAVTDENRYMKKIGYVRLEIDYKTAVNAASGQLWDLDENAYGTEQFTVKAYNSSGQAVASLTSPDVSYASNLDGLPWTWSITGSDITKIVMESVGTRTNYLGLAFDNFDHNTANANADAKAHAAPLPAAAYVGLAGMAGLYARRRAKMRTA